MYIYDTKFNKIIDTMHMYQNCAMKIIIGIIYTELHVYIYQYIVYELTRALNKI